MSRWTPCKRREFIRRLAIPSNEEYSVAQLRMMIAEVEEILGRKIMFEEWNQL